MLSSFCVSQNLVKNSSFENILCEPKKASQLNLAQGWSAPGSSSDLYSLTTKKKDYKIPNNLFGQQNVVDGNTYSGIYSSMYNNTKINPIYHEYLQGTLIDSLEKGKTYLIEYFYSLAERSEYYEKSLGVMFLNSKISSFEDKLKLLKMNNLSVKDRDKLSDKINWNKFFGEYIAQGGEKFLLIGNFENDSEWRKNNKGVKIGSAAYYYIDNVSVTLLEDSSIGTTSKFLSKQSIILENIYFESGSSDLKESSFPALNELADNLSVIENVSEIKISGHTDNIGKEEDNLKLSEARAKAVSNYLVKRGIDKNKIIFVGYGSSKPIATNDTDEGKEKNRRVELLIKQEEQ